MPWSWLLWNAALERKYVLFCLPCVLRSKFRTDFLRRHRRSGISRGICPPRNVPFLTKSWTSAWVPYPQTRIPGRACSQHWIKAYELSKNKHQHSGRLSQCKSDWGVWQATITVQLMFSISDTKSLQSCALTEVTPFAHGVQNWSISELNCFLCNAVFALCSVVEFRGTRNVKTSQAHSLVPFLNGCYEFCLQIFHGNYWVKKRQDFTSLINSFLVVLAQMRDAFFSTWDKAVQEADPERLVVMRPRSQKRKKSIRGNQTQRHECMLRHLPGRVLCSNWWINSCICVSCSLGMLKCRCHNHLRQYGVQELNGGSRKIRENKKISSKNKRTNSDEFTLIHWFWKTLGQTATKVLIAITQSWLIPPLPKSSEN